MNKIFQCLVCFRKFLILCIKQFGIRRNDAFLNRNFTWLDFAFFILYDVFEGFLIHLIFWICVNADEIFFVCSYIFNQESTKTPKMLDWFGLLSKIKARLAKKSNMSENIMMRYEIIVTNPKVFLSNEKKGDYQIVVKLWRGFNYHLSLWTIWSQIRISQLNSD